MENQYYGSSQEPWLDILQVEERFLATESISKDKTHPATTQTIKVIEMYIGRKRPNFYIWEQEEFKYESYRRTTAYELIELLKRYSWVPPILLLDSFREHCRPLSDTSVVFSVATSTVDEIISILVKGSQ